LESEIPPLSAFCLASTLLALACAIPPARSTPEFKEQRNATVLYVFAL
jgi:hypothetical protein